MKTKGKTEVLQTPRSFLDQIDPAMYSGLSVIIDLTGVRNVFKKTLYNIFHMSPSVSISLTQSLSVRLFDSLIYIPFEFYHSLLLYSPKEIYNSIFNHNKLYK